MGSLIKWNMIVEYNCRLLIREPPLLSTASKALRTTKRCVSIKPTAKCNCRWSISTPLVTISGAEVCGALLANMLTKCDFMQVYDICMFVFSLIRMHIPFVYMIIHAYKYVHIHVHICMYVCVCVDVCIYVYT